MPSEQEVRTHLQKIAYPGSRHDIVTLGLVEHIGVQGNDIVIHFRPSSASDQVLQHVGGKISTVLSALELDKSWSMMVAALLVVITKRR